MKTTVYHSDFIDAFARLRPDNFSCEALNLLFDYLEEYEESTGEEIELDVIAICCDYNEMPTDDIIREYRIDVSECEDESDREQAVIDYLEEHTSYVGETSALTFVFANF